MLGEIQGDIESGSATLPDGHTLCWKANGVGGRIYYSTEVGGGVLAWDTSLVYPTTLISAIAVENLLLSQRINMRSLEAQGEIEDSYEEELEDDTLPSEPEVTQDEYDTIVQQEARKIIEQARNTIENATQKLNFRQMVIGCNWVDAQKTLSEIGVRPMFFTQDKEFLPTPGSQKSEYLEPNDMVLFLDKSLTVVDVEFPDNFRD
jgi:hypothetical protein